ncbi:DUF2744 domain-containing protein [Nocardia farcinica]|uniref:phage gene 29 protein family protein n=1 Tax=Nocardia farcinica TaxID=37329 RepID=UPI0018941FF3|nr:DUF2744 domain-containing protein [Nocardia farcinica]MBF6291796.1 DUF2744 domain-containing protein [Nocardia farcinica]
MQVPNGETRQQRRAREREHEKRTAQTERQLSKMVGGTIDGREFHEWPKWEGQGVPTRENCDLDNPRQKFLWMFTAMPGMQGAPLILPPEYWELMSWRICVLGGDLVHEPGQKWQAPVTNMATSPWTAAGKWVHPDEPEPERKTIKEMIEALPQQDRAELRAAVLDQMGLGDSTTAAPADRPGPPPERYTVAALAERVGRSVPEVLEALASVGLPHLHAGSVVGREVGLRLIEHMGL